MPAVSVLMPSFDAAATIAAALESVRRQHGSGAEFECIVVDDGSRDASAEIAERFAREDARFRVLRRAHEGLVGSLNAGLAACGAALVARMDADDVMRRDRLASQRALMEAQPGLAACGTHVRIFPRAALGEGTREYEAWIASIDSQARVRQDLFVECPLVHPTLLARASVLRAAGGWRDRGVPEDYDLVLRMHEAGHAVGVVPRRLLSWRTGSRRLQRTSPAYSLEAFARLKAEFLARGFLRDTAEYVLVGYGNSGKLLRPALAREGKRPLAIVDAFRHGNSIDGIPMLPPAALATLPRRPILASISGAKGRAEIRRELDGRGFVELADYICVA